MTTFVEFTVRSGGNNMNGGSDHTNAEVSTSALYSQTNGGWNSGTGVYTPTSGNPSLTVTAGDWAHVFTDGSTTPTFVARVTGTSPTTLTLSTTAKGGTAPVTAGTGISINVGGAWQGTAGGTYTGPAGTTYFPWDFITGAMIDASGNHPRVNLKNNQTYSITTPILHSVLGPVRFQGYTTTFGDLGKATIDGGTSGTSYVLLTISSNGADRVHFFDLIFQNNGVTGSANGMSGIDLSRNRFIRCVVNNVRGSGFVNGTYIECEAYQCNTSNTANNGGWGAVASAVYCIRCIAHDNTGSNNTGFYTQNALCFFIDCISANNQLGWFVNNVFSEFFVSCDAYNNTSDGIFWQGASTNLQIENCNFISNGGWGINLNMNNNSGLIRNCGFFSNPSGQVNTGTGSEIDVTGLVTYSGSPYNSASTGDFRITLAAAKNAGIGSFQQTNNSPNPFAGTIGYPDIGAAQHLDSGGSTTLYGLINVG